MRSKKINKIKNVPKKVVAITPKKKKPSDRKSDETPSAPALSALAPFDKSLFLRRASFIRLHILSLRKRIGRVTPESPSWVKIGATHLDRAIEHFKELPGLSPYMGDYTPGPRSESKKTAVSIAKCLCEDVIDLLYRTHDAIDRDSNEKFYDEADLILDTVSLDLEHFQNEDDLEDKSEGKLEGKSEGIEGKSESNLEGKSESKSVGTPSEWPVHV